MTGSADEPIVVDVPEESRFELRLGDAVAGHVAYRRRTPGTTSLIHTEIASGYEGRGLGSVLARGVLDRLRADGEAVLPFCPFVRGWIERHPDYLDLVPPDRRADFDLPAAPG